MNRAPAPRSARPRLLHSGAVPPSPFSALPRFGRGSFWLFVVVAAVSAFVSDLPLARQFLLGPGFAGELALWQPLSAPFLFPDGQLAGLIATGLLQWFVGSPLEARLGTARYLGLVVGAAALGYLALGLVGLAVPAALAVPQGGSAPIDVAALAGFGVVLAHYPVSVFGVLPVSARGFAAVAAALLLVGPLLRDGWPALIPGAVAALVAVLVARRWRNAPASGKVPPRGGNGKPKGKRPRHLRIVDGREQYLN